MAESNLTDKIFGQAQPYHIILKCKASSIIAVMSSVKIESIRVGHSWYWFSLLIYHHQVYSFYCWDKICVSIEDVLSVQMGEMVTSKFFALRSWYVFFVCLCIIISTQILCCSLIRKIMWCFPWMSETQGVYLTTSLCRDWNCLSRYLVVGMFVLLPLPGPNEAESFQLEMSGLLSELACPYSVLTSGDITQRLLNRTDCLLLLSKMTANFNLTLNILRSRIALFLLFGKLEIFTPLLSFIHTHRMAQIHTHAHRTQWYVFMERRQNDGTAS